MYMLHKLREQGLNVRVFESGTDVGGTWYWNRYPGARCDVESVDYSYSFSHDLQQEWDWSERYPQQPEIFEYAKHVADTFDLRKNIQFETKVTSAHFDDSNGLWQITTDRGDHVEAQFCITAVGCLSTWSMPNFPGRDSFEGKSYHTGDWPKAGVDFTGQRVAVIGTGSSAIQVIPEVALQAEHLTVFQRTPNFSLPANQRPLQSGDSAQFKARYDEIREKARYTPTGLGTISYGTRSVLEVPPEDLNELLEEDWTGGGFAMLFAFTDILINEESNRIIADFVRSKIRSVVKDPVVAELLSPTDHPLGTKRICMDTGYFETYNRPNVELVSVKQTPITAITPKGVQIGEKVYEVDSIIYATGYDAMTGALSRMDIRGHNDRKLVDDWSEGPASYLGLGVNGYPNLFTITGPGSPSVLANMLTSIEQHVEWISDCIAYLRENGVQFIEATQEAQDAWVEHMHETAHSTLYVKAASWYMGANIPGKPRMFMPYVGGVGIYRLKCDEVAGANYQGFALAN